jgi:hypothetical protein
MNKKTLYDEQHEYYKRENDVVKWTTILFIGIPLGLGFILFCLVALGI